MRNVASNSGAQLGDEHHMLDQTSSLQPSFAHHNSCRGITHTSDGEHTVTKTHTSQHVGLIDSPNDELDGDVQWNETNQSNSKQDAQSNPTNVIKEEPRNIQIHPNNTPICQTATSDVLVPRDPRAMVTTTSSHAVTHNSAHADISETSKSTVAPDNAAKKVPGSIYTSQNSATMSRDTVGKQAHNIDCHINLNTARMADSDRVFPAVHRSDLAHSLLRHDSHVLSKCVDTSLVNLQKQQKQKQPRQQQKHEPQEVGEEEEVGKKRTQQPQQPHTADEVVLNNTISEMQVEPHEKENPIVQFIVAEYNSFNAAIEKTYFPRPKLNVPNQQGELVNEESAVDGLLALDHKRKRTVAEMSVISSENYEHGTIEKRRRVNPCTTATYSSSSTPAGVTGVVYTRNAHAIGLSLAYTSDTLAHQSKRVKTEEGSEDDWCSAQPKSEAKRDSVFLAGASSELVSVELLGQNICKHPEGCMRDAKGYTKGLCYKHGGTYRCTHESNCPKQAMSNKLCCAHGGGRICKYGNGCLKHAVTKGLCAGHGGAKLCTHESDCKNSAQSKGLCAGHGGARQNVTGAGVSSSVSSGRSSVELLQQDICKHPEGCMRDAKGYTKGLCYKHGGTYRCTHESNCPKQAMTNKLCCAHGGGRICKYENGCLKHAVTKGLCAVHGGAKLCTHESDCKNSAQSKGLCAGHGGSRQKASGVGVSSFISSARSSVKLLKQDMCKHLEGCVRDAKGYTKGLCYKHGGTYRCTHESNCPKQAMTNKLCCAHGGGRICKHSSGCAKHAVSKGFCIAHGGMRNSTTAK